MLSNADKKLVVSLRQKKYRIQHNLFVIEGVKIVNEFLYSNNRLYTIFATKQWIDENQALISKHLDVKIQLVTERELEQISSLKTPNQVLALVEKPDYQPNIKQLKLILCLDGIRDPGNLGTIIRLADWYHLKEIFCSSDSVDCWNPKVVQASMGSLSRIKVHYLELESFFKTNEEIPVYATTLNGADIHEERIKIPACLVIGNEAHGVRPDIQSLATQHLQIPRLGQAESLNAAISTAIFLDRMLFP